MRVRNRWLIRLSILLISYLLFQFYPYAHHQTDSLFIRKRGRDPLVIAHGGAKKLYPENTFLAFDKSIEMGVDAIEMDIHLSKDNVLCTIHDKEIAHYTNHKGKVWDYTYQELSLFNFAYHFQDLKGNYPYRTSNDKNLTLANVESLFSKYGNAINYVLEIKEQGERGRLCAKLLYDLIVQYKLIEQCCVASFHQDVMAYFKDINKVGVPSIMDYDSSEDFVVANYLGYNRLQTYTMNGLMLPLSKRDIILDDNYLIYKIHQQGLFVFYWTIDDEKTMRKLIQQGVDGIITDRIDILISILNEK